MIFCTNVGKRLTIHQFQTCGAENPPDTTLFAAAQQQIYNLMKFDSFSRYPRHGTPAPGFFHRPTPFAEFGFINQY
jgi:hypothetical protein